ncbi:DNA translocase FtsK 4TM domain-containing protein, partial [Methylogaea oryzae]
MQLDNDNIIETPTPSVWNRGLRELAFLGYGALAVFLLIALISYDLADGGWSHSGGDEPIRNTAGAVGAWMADLCLYLFGIASYLLPLAVASRGYRAYRGLSAPVLAAPWLKWLRYGAALATLVVAAAMVQILWPHAGLSLPGDSGGVLGMGLASWLLGSFGSHGAKLLLWAAFLGGLTLAGGISWIAVVDWAGQTAVNGFMRLFGRLRRPRRAEYGG